MTAPMTPLRDAIGTVHAPASGAVRIVSLVPSLTELLFDLGLGDAVAGRTVFCVHPRHQVRTVPKIGGTKTIDLERLAALNPTHVLVNMDETPRAVADTLASWGCSVIVTHPVRVEDNLALFALLGHLFGREEAAARLADRFTRARARLADVAARLPWRNVLYLIWKDPWMTVGRDTYVSHLLAAAHLRTLPAASAPRYPTISLDNERLGEVDLVLFASEPFPFKARHLDAFRAAFPEHAGKALTIDGQMVSWYGSRAILALDYLADLIAQTRPLGAT